MNPGVPKARSIKVNMSPSCWGIPFKRIILLKKKG